MMIQRIALFILLAGFMGPMTAQDEKLKIATVDMQELFKEYYKTNDAQKQLNIERARIQKENNERLTRIRELDDELKTMRKQVEDPTLSDSKRQEIFEELKMKQQDGISLNRERQEYLQRRNQALREKMGQQMKGILEEIRKLVEEQANKDAYNYVFDKSALSASQVPFLLYAQDSADITPSLLEILNKDAPKESVQEDAEEAKDE